MEAAVSNILILLAGFLFQVPDQLSALKLLLWPVEATLRVRIPS